MQLEDDGSDDVGIVISGGSGHIVICVAKAPGLYAN